MRVTIGAARRRKKKRLFKEARGNFGGRSKLLRTVKETILKSRMYAFRIVVHSSVPCVVCGSHV